MPRAVYNIGLPRHKNKYDTKRAIKAHIIALKARLLRDEFKEQDELLYDIVNYLSIDDKAGNKGAKRRRVASMGFDMLGVIDR